MMPCLIPRSPALIPWNPVNLAWEELDIGDPPINEVSGVPSRMAWGLDGASNQKHEPLCSRHIVAQGPGI